METLPEVLSLTAP